MQYRTRSGDILDAIAYTVYGSEQVVIDVYEANPGLADYGPVLPAGLVVELPTIDPPGAGEKPTIKLWD